MTSAIVLFFLVLPGLDSADSPPSGEEPLSLLGRYTLACPICQQTFTAIACPQSNIRGGVDRDFFARALGPQPEFYRIATCPRCGYSGYPGDFDANTVFPPGFREKVLQSPKLVLPAGFGPESDPRDLDARDRYALAVTCYQWLGRSDEALGWLHLRASWIYREEGAVLPPDDRLARAFRYIQRWRPQLGPGDNQADGELRTAARIAEAIAHGDFNRYQRPYIELALALILRRHGENQPAMEMLDRLADYEPFSQALKDGIARMRESIRLERAQQLRAADCFDRALMADQIAPPNKAPACYLLGELYRRLGRDREAVRWYDRALADPSLPPDLRTWAREARRAVAGTRTH
ncbi:MAG TPA: DUF2225 domain-containing protein [Phycisphaerae bacterium]|jgi:hypothetical protein|nr:DUF2225 domain-containing protein [Phycisphaerae bacterium]HOB75011.1 DUF2225 domain-containing protein [Phycisphaerae bacterium]HOJ55081.1 DUF2225 domain-containing protein [Phycisphaerae bacterium]HOL26868.1 DUF2225 domain-containing protein [Phycisphaerae bacterium]HPP20823.1 DUF2225 domain-containing protein [Phycisphaerae bacterium]